MTCFDPKIFVGYYPGFRGYHPGLYNPYNFGWGYNNYNQFNSPLRYPWQVARLPQPQPAHQAAAPAPANPNVDMTPGTQYHFQDGLGNINYGYSNVNSAKQEVGNIRDGVQGQYSYVDANGIQQTVSYVADNNGFRVLSDSRLNSLDGFGMDAAANLAAPETRKKREADAYYPFGYSFAAGYPYYGYGYNASPYRLGYGNGFGYYFG